MSDNNVAIPERREAHRWADEAMRLLDLYVRGFKPLDVTRDFVEKYRAVPENSRLDIFDSNPAYTDSQLLVTSNGGENKLPKLDYSLSAHEQADERERQLLNYIDRYHHSQQELLVALKENARLMFELSKEKEDNHLLGNGADGLLDRAEQAEAALALRDEEIALFKRAFANSIANRRVDQKWDNECEEYDYWIAAAKAELARLRGEKV